MSTDADQPADVAQGPQFVVAAPDSFQPIRIPIEGYRELHEATEDSLREFVAGHRERFPQIALGEPSGRRRQVTR